MKTLKKILGSVLASAILMTGMTAFATELVATEENIVPRATMQTNLASWGTYLYFADTDGVNIYNLATEERVASWAIGDIKAKLGSSLSGFVPYQIEVSDDYIVMASKPANDSAYIVAFKNEGSYDNEVPELVAMMQNFNTPVIRMYGNKIVVVDCVSDETINNARIQVERNGIVFWMIDLDRYKEFSGYKNNTVGMTSVAVKNMRENGLAHLFTGYGTDSYIKADYLWKQLDINGDTATFVTYNDRGFAPYAALMLHKINLETYETNTYVVSDRDVDGLITILDTDEPLTKNEVLSLKVCVANNQSLLVDASVVGSGNVFVEGLEDGKTKVCIGADGLNKLGDLATKDQITTGNMLLSLIYDETEYAMTYNSGMAYSVGTVSTKDGYSYMISGVDNRKDNKLWVAREDGSIVVDGEVMFAIGNYSGWLTSVVAGDKLVGFIPNVNNYFAALDISDPENIVPNSAGGPLFTGAGVVSNNEYGTAVMNAGRIYYPIADNKGGGVGFIKTDVEEFTSDLFYREGVLPILIHGKASNADEVQINIDGTDYTVATSNGLYSFPIYKIESGVEHTVIVRANGNEEEIAFTALVPELVQLENIVIDEDGFKADILNRTNNSDEPIDSLTIILASYDAEGNYKDSRIGTAIIPNGETVTYKRKAIPQIPNNGYVKVMLLDGESPLCSPYVIDGNEISHNMAELIAGKNANPTLEIEENDADKKVTIRGNDTAGNRVFLKISIGSKNVYIDQIYCDENGNYEYVYYYAKDGHNGEYSVLAGASNQETLRASFNSADQGELNSMFAEICGMDGKELLTYLSENPDKAEMLSIDLAEESFAGLNEKRQTKVMDEVADYISGGYRTGVYDVFARATNALVEEQADDDALYELNKAKYDKIKSVLEEHKDRFGISDSLWEKYLASNLTAVNKLLASKYEFEEISDVEEYIEKAIKKSKEEKGSESSSLGDGGGNATGGGQKITAPPLVIDPFTPVEAKDLFSDLAGVDWAKDSIHGLYMAGVVDGTGDGRFLPNETVTREQFIKMIVTAFDIKMQGEALKFNDVDENAWYYEYISIASSVGLTKGDDKGSFGIGEELTREDAAVFVARALDCIGMTVPAKDQKTEFKDSAEISEYAKASVELMQEAGIINGVGDGEFAPKGSCTRAMAAKIIYGLMSAAK